MTPGLPFWRWWAGWVAAGSAGVLGHCGYWWQAGGACVVVAALVAWGVRDRLVATKAMMMALQRSGSTPDLHKDRSGIR